MKLLIPATALLCCAMATPSLAADNTAMFYLGGNISAVDFDLGDIESALDAAVTAAIATPGITADSDTQNLNVGFGLNLGYQFNRFVAMELGYRNYGVANTSFNATDGTDVIVSEGEIAASGVGLGLIGFIPIGTTFNLFARVDAMNQRTSVETTTLDTFAGTFTRVSDSKTEVRVGYGIGMQWNFESCSSFRIEVSQVTSDLPPFGAQRELAVTSVSIGLMKAL